MYVIIANKRHASATWAVSFHHLKSPLENAAENIEEEPVKRGASSKSIAIRSATGRLSEVKFVNN